MSKDDSAIKEDNRPGIQCESSPPTPRSLRLERVAQALAQSSEELQQQMLQQQSQQLQQRSATGASTATASAVPLHVQPPFVRYTAASGLLKRSFFIHYLHLVWIYDSNLLYIIT